MEQRGLIKVVQFCYENKNKKIKESAPPSNPTWEEMNYTWGELGGSSWADIGKISDKHAQIASIIGNDNKKDIKHLDSAYMAGCEAFVTSDKGDICSKKNEIYQLLSIHVFHVTSEWNDFVKFCHKNS